MTWPGLVAKTVKECPALGPFSSVSTSDDQVAVCDKYDQIHTAPVGQHDFTKIAVGRSPILSPSGLHMAFVRSVSPAEWETTVIALESRQEVNLGVRSSTPIAWANNNVLLYSHQHHSFLMVNPVLKFGRYDIASRKRARISLPQGYSLRGFLSLD